MGYHEGFHYIISMFIALYHFAPPLIFSRKIPVEAERTKAYLESHIHVQSVGHPTFAPNKLIQFCYFLPPPSEFSRKIPV